MQEGTTPIIQGKTEDIGTQGISFRSILKSFEGK